MRNRPRYQANVNDPLWRKVDILNHESVIIIAIVNRQMPTIKFYFWKKTCLSWAMLTALLQAFNMYRIANDTNTQTKF